MSYYEEGAMSAFRKINFRDLNQQVAEARRTRDDIKARCIAMVQSEDFDANDPTYQELKARAAGLDGEIRYMDDMACARAVSERVESVMAGSPAASPTDDPHQVFAGLLSRREAGRVEIRSVGTANSGSRLDVAPTRSRGAQLLSTAAGIKFTTATALRFEAPYWPELTAQAPTAEGGTKPATADPTLTQISLEAFAVTSTISDQAIRFGVGLEAVSQRLQAEAVFSANAAFADDAESEAGTPIVFTGSAAQMVDTGIAAVGSATGNHPTAILLNAADYPKLSGKTGADSGEDIASKVAAWNGVPLLVSNSITAGVAVIIDGRGWQAHGTPMTVESQPLLTTNQVVARAELYYATFPSYAGAAVAVALA